VDRLGVELLEHGGGVGHVREHDGDDLALALYRTACGKDFVDKVLGGVGMGSVEVQRFGFFGLTKIVAAPVTKITVGGTDLAALRAHQTHFTAAFVTKTCILWLLCSTFGTLHRSTPLVTEPGRQVLITCLLIPELNHLQTGSGTEEVVERNKINELYDIPIETRKWKFRSGEFGQKTRSGAAISTHSM
jgi:hypothetical protein